MIDISVKRIFRAPIDVVFEAVINADKYLRIPKVITVDRVRESTAGKDGVGTQREVTLGLIWFREEFVFFERPTRVDYRVIESRPHFEHQLGSFQFSSVDGGTEVTWSSNFFIPTPLFANVFSALAKPIVEATFYSALLAMDKNMRVSVSVLDAI